MRYQHCIFDLYGTLVDIHTDEASPRLWARMAEFYRRRGAVYQPGELRTAYFRLVRQLEGGASPRQDGHEAHPEIQIERVFRRLYEEKGAQTVGLSTVYIRSNLSPDEPVPQAGHVLNAVDLQQVGKFLT